MKRPGLVLIIGGCMMLASFILAALDIGIWVLLLIMSIMVLIIGVFCMMYVGGRKKDNFSGRDTSVSDVRDRSQVPNDTPADIWDQLESGKKP